MRLPINYSNESQLRAAFSWITRTGAGVKFGSRPVGWYQMHQYAALDALQALMPEGGEIRCRSARFEGKRWHGRRWVPLATVREIYAAADKR